jgi:hypothetical protein
MTSNPCVSAKYVKFSDALTPGKPLQLAVQCTFAFKALSLAQYSI